MGSTKIAPPLAGQVLAAGSRSFVMAEWRDGGGPAGQRRLIAPLHLHRSDDEAWYVLEGALCVQMDDDVVEARAGAAVFVSRGTPHTYWNPAEQPVRYLLVMTANIYQMIQAIHATSDRSAETMRAIFRRHDSELLG